MRSLVVDKLNVTEMTVFNRFDDKFDPNEYHFGNRCCAYDFVDFVCEKN